MDKSLSNWIKLEFLPSVSFDCRVCLLIKQSLYLGDARNFVSVGGGITEVRRFHSSFHTAQSGLTLTKGMFIYSIPGRGHDPNMEIVPNSSIRPALEDYYSACRVLKACCKRRRTGYPALVSRLSRIVQVSGFSDLTSFSSVSG
ncbi:hypothetical protein C5167_041814 [Papaver somniferum]|nr:hypothetical protein C5167_041814 [Papaver somniferum]